MPATRATLLRTAAACTALAAAALCKASPADAVPLSGRWITASGNLEVDIQPCGQALCGTVTRELARHSMSRPGETMQPVDAAPIVGRVLLQDLRPGFCPAPGEDITYSLPDECGLWHGTIYNRENGRTYRATLQVDGGGKLVLRGYMGLPLIGRTQLWSRSEGSASAQASQVQP